MKTAPQTAKIPSVTREVIAIWEKELDEFVIDIQERLENIAVSISQRNEHPVPHHDLLDAQRESIPVAVDTPSVAVAPERRAPPVIQDRSIVQNETNDRLQAIKHKLAARLQGEAS